MYTDSQAAYWDRVAGVKTFTHPVDMGLLGRYAAKDAVVVDYGCGYGRVVQQLLDAGYSNVAGYDTSAGLIERGIASGCSRLIHFQDPLAFDRLVPDNSVDAVLLFAVLTCVPANSGQQAIVDMLQRKLKPGGVIYISDYYLQPDTGEVVRYGLLNADEQNYGVFSLPEGATFRHHTKEWIATLLKKFTMRDERIVPVQTMNGSAAEAFQLIAQKDV